MRHLKSCGFLLVLGSPVQRFLLMVHPDRLDLPKGHIEPGETEHECALREMEEETGIPAQAVAVDPTFRFETHYEVRSPRWGHEPCQKTTVLFLGYLQSEPAVTATEHTGFRWYDWAPPHALQPATIDPLLRQLEAHLDEADHWRPPASVGR